MAVERGSRFDYWAHTTGESGAPIQSAVGGYGSNVCPGCGHTGASVTAHPVRNMSGGASGDYDESVHCNGCGRLREYRTASAKYTESANGYR